MSYGYNNNDYQQGGRRGEADSYYGEQSRSQPPYGSGPQRQGEYGQGYNSGPQHGNEYGQSQSQYGSQRGDEYGRPQHGSQYGNEYGQQSQYGSHDNRQPHHQQSFQNEPQSQESGDGERGLAGGLAGGVAGAFAGHKMGHGVLGALGGAFAGHKLQDFVHDKKEKHEQEQKLQEQIHHQPAPAYSPGSHGHPQPDHHSPGPDRSASSYGGNFTASSHDIHLEGDYNLRATCQRQGGGTQVSTLSLNRVLTNDDGHFRWVSGSGGHSSYTVQQGDTLRDIARRFHCGFNDIARTNNIPNPDMIYPGQNLQVPVQGEGNFGASARDVRLVDGGRALEAELRNNNGHWNRSRVDLDDRIGNQDGELHLV